MQTPPCDPGERESKQDPLLEKAKAIFGVSYLFPYQRLAIHNILSGLGIYGGAEAEAAPGDQLVILPTGAGKSLCFQLPAALIPGPTLVIYPLLSLMADQERRLAAAGISNRILRGGQSREERSEIWRDLGDGRVKFLIANPEVAAGAGVRERLKALGVLHLVIDEAHCVAEWGETFRPAYLALGGLRRELGVRVTTAFTATASPAVLDRIVLHLFEGKRPHLIAGNPDRPNIRYRVVPVLSKAQALVRLLCREGPEAAASPGGFPPDAPAQEAAAGEGEAQTTAVRRDDPSRGESLERPAVVFCATRGGAEETARLLRRRLGEKEIFFYHAGLERAEKKAVEDWFMKSNDGILAATCAYGMGVDKANVRTVIHRDVPGSVEAYLQESGRAGRDGKASQAVLLVSSEDEKKRARCASAYEASRFGSLLDYAGADSCRRRKLIALLGGEADDCSGCDVCDGTRIERPWGEELVLDFVARNRRRFGREEAALVLAGARNAKTAGALRDVPAFGGLRGWSTEEVAEALDDLLEKRSLRRCGRFPWKYALTLPRRKNGRGGLFRSMISRPSP